MKSSPFARHVYSVQRYEALTAPRYATLMARGVAVHPVCCFGDIESGEVVTVGLNPSLGEFSNKRWPTLIDHFVLAERCKNYFRINRTEKPHWWFEPWIAGLRHLSCSYADGSAVHMDLSPRPTRFVSELERGTEELLFIEMVERDLWTFFGTLELVKNAKLVLIAGSVTGAYYINGLLQKFAPDYGYILEGTFDPGAQPGAGKTARHFLTKGIRRLPVFFCSTSPSGRNKEILPQRVKEHAKALREAMKDPNTWEV